MYNDEPNANLIEKFKPESNLKVAKPEPCDIASNKLICQMRKKKPSFPFTRPRIACLGAFFPRPVLFPQKSRFFTKRRASTIF